MVCDSKKRNVFLDKKFQNQPIKRELFFSQPYTRNRLHDPAFLPYLEVTTRAILPHSLQGCLWSHQDHQSHTNVRSLFISLNTIMSPSFVLSLAWFLSCLSGSFFFINTIDYPIGIFSQLTWRQPQFPWSCHFSFLPLFVFHQTLVRFLESKVSKFTIPSHLTNGTTLSLPECFVNISRLSLVVSSSHWRF